MSSTLSKISFGPWPIFAEDEQLAVQRILQSGKVNYWTGQEGREFEREFASYAGTNYAVAMANGTLTLEACLLALGISAGDEVIVTPRSFMASASSVVTVGATPVWADVELESGNLSASTIAPKITPRTKAILLVHMAGWPCEMDEILDLASAHGIAVIEDCAQCHGATYKGKPLGGFGVVGSWSFCQDKILSTAGEGGMVTTNDQRIWDFCWSIKDHGKNFDTVYNKPHPPGYRWLHETFGSNWRMPEICSAVGRIQLNKLPSWKAARTKNAQILMDRLKDESAVVFDQVPSHIEHAFYRLYARIRPEALSDGWTRERIIEEVAPRFHLLTGSCCEMYLEKNFQDAGLAPIERRLPNAKQLSETSLCFLVHPTQTDHTMHEVADALQAVLKVASR